MRTNRLGLSLLGILILLTGCSDMRILEETGFIQSVSYDSAPDGNIHYAISVPISNPDIQATSLRIFLETDAISSKAARINLSRETNLQLASGQLRAVLIGLPLAKSGPWPHMDTLFRDPTISEKTKIIVVNGRAASLLSKNYASHPRTGKYIDHLIEKETKSQTIPESTIYSFVRDYYDDGIEPVAPIIKDKGDTISIDGLALFKKDKYIGKIIPDNMLYFSFLLGDLREGEIAIDLTNQTEESKTVMINSLVSKREVEVDRNSRDDFSVTIRVKVLATVSEYIGDLNLIDPSDASKLEEDLTAIFNQRCHQIIDMLQEKNTDSLGIGKFVRNSMPYRDWKNMDWYGVYPTMNIKCVMKVEIKDHGFR